VERGQYGAGQFFQHGRRYTSIFAMVRLAKKSITLQSFICTEAMQYTMGRM